jgi:hypothetical protein
MRAYSITAATLAVLATTACGPTPEVHTTPTPDPGLLNRLTFYIMPEPGYLGGKLVGANHAPAVNPATGAALRDDIVASLKRHGYVEANADPGVLVEYYLTIPSTADVTDWDSGYLWRPAWARGQLPGSVNLTPAEYADGAVVIDLTDPATGTLLWEGHGLVDLPPGERQLAHELRQTIAAIVDRMPGPSVALAPVVEGSPAR